jgi:hypothetical protein
MAIPNQILAAICGVIHGTVSAVITTLDGRSNRQPIQRLFTIRTDTWALVNQNPLYDSGWFQENFRCTKAVFDAIATRIEDRWHEVNEELHHNTVFRIRDRVAVTMHYLTYEGSLRASGQVFGLSKSSAWRYVQEVLLVLNECYLRETIRLPNTQQEWMAIADGFEEMCGVPNVVGAIDGSLFHVKRFKDFEGWYCRKV